MLRKTRKKLKVILGGIFPGRYVRIGRGDSITVKNNMFSLRAEKYRIREVLGSTLPDHIKDVDISVQCREAVNKDIKAGNLPNAIDNAYDLFVICQKNDIEGVNIPQRKDYAEIIRDWWDETRPLSFLKRNDNLFGEITTVHVRTKDKLIAAETTLRGFVATGVKEFDEQFQQMIRYRGAIPAVA